MEAINTILEMAEYKKKNCKYLIVMGCLVQRYYDELIKALPEVDLFIKIDEYDRMWQKIEKLVNEDIVEISTTNISKKISEIKPLPMPTHNEFFERVITTGTNFAYLKIGEGCSNRCTYCAIPYIRGPFVSRPKEEIIEEAKILANKGVKEIIIIAQDTTKYGVDIYGEPKLAELLQQISEAVTNCIIHGYENRIGIVKIHAQLIQGEIKIEIADNGKGIENIEMAKEPLYTTKPNLERSGMGFTIMESFMDSMEVESIVGLGTKVTMKKKIKKQDEQNKEEKMPNSTYAMSV